MDSVIAVALFDIAVLLFIFLKKNNDKVLYTITPEEECADNLKAIEENLKAIDNLNNSDYVLGSGHLYNKKAFTNK